MSKIFKIALIGIINIVFLNSSRGQNQFYTQNDFEQNKVHDEVYNLWKFKSNWFAKSEDSISYFVDDRNYKGIVNYGVTFKSKSYRNFHFIENLSMCFLTIEISKLRYNSKEGIVDIEGFVSGNDNWGWNELVKMKKIKSDVEIFLGEKSDTIKTCFLGKIVNKDSVEVKFRNKTADEFTVLDQFPAFYFKKFSSAKTILGNKKPFKIKGKVTPNTFLAFGSWASYSQIFDIGAMIYNPTKNKQNKVIQRKNNDCKPLINNNKLLSTSEKEQPQKEENKYYFFTQNAENYILARQYAKAKEEYNLLTQNFSVLFARDIHNAIRCAVLSRDFKNAFWWGEKLASKGIELPYFNARIFTMMKKNPEWKNFSIKYDSICKAAKAKWNLKLKKELEVLLKEDQADYGLANRKTQKTLYETTEKITAKLIDLLKEQGYPSEERIGSFVKNDTTLISFPDFNVLVLHAVQQKPDNLKELENLLEKSSNALEYDGKRSANKNDQFDSCFRIYKGNLYNSKACGRNDLEVRKISFKFKNPNSFIMDYGNFVIEAYNAKNPKESDDNYAQNYNLIMKLTDDWDFYDK